MTQVLQRLSITNKGPSSRHASRSSRSYICVSIHRHDQPEGVSLREVHRELVRQEVGCVAGSSPRRREGSEFL